MKKIALVLLSAVVTASHAMGDVIDIFESTDNNRNPAIDARITLNGNVNAGASNVFGQGTVNNNVVTFNGGPLPPGKSHRMAIASTNGVNATKFEFSFAANPNVEVQQTGALIDMESGKYLSNGVLHGFVSVTNDDTNSLTFSNFAAAVNIPESNFGESQSQIQSAISNNLFLSSGTPASVPSTFQLSPGATDFFDLGPVSASGYEAAVYNVAYTDQTLPVSSFDFGGVASNNLVPEPASLTLGGIAALTIVVCRFCRRTTSTA
jgi:hypothetical protein